jgi:HK97 gp10 family phage protein
MARAQMIAGWTAKLRGPIAEMLETHYGPAIVADAKSACPVDTGKLKASIHQVMRADGMAVQIHADAKAEGRDGTEADYTYAGYVELGTRHMAPEPYLRPALFRKRG